MFILLAPSNCAAKACRRNNELSQHVQAHMPPATRTASGCCLGALGHGWLLPHAASEWACIKLETLWNSSQLIYLAKHHFDFFPYLIIVVVRHVLV